MVYQRDHGEDIGAMMALVDRALALNPNFARGWNISGILRYWAGQLDIAIEHAEASLRLSPRARVGTSLQVIGTAHTRDVTKDEVLGMIILGTCPPRATPGAGATVAGHA